MDDYARYEKRHVENSSSRRREERRMRKDREHEQDDFPPASNEKRLTKFLLDGYKKVGQGGRPTTNSSEAVSVQFGLAMIQMDLEEQINTLTVSVWCRYVSDILLVATHPQIYPGIL